MAGAYPDAPSRRMAWDADGSVALWRQTAGTGSPTAMTELTAGEKTNVNGEQHGDHITAWSDQRTYQTYFLFPELREIDGVFASSSASACAAGLAETSGDTTNGLDGTWNTLVADLTNVFSTIPEYRDDIVSTAVATEAGLRIIWVNAVDTTVSASSIHIYGTISPAETPDRIIFLDTPNADAQFTKVLDFGDVPRGQTTTRQFKLKNNSASKTINTIQVTAEDLYLNAGDWYTFGDDDISYQATFSVGNLGPGATKALYMKQVIPDAETLGLQAGRIKVSHASVT